MNQVTFVGRLCREVQMREVGEKAAVTNNVIAVTRTFKDRNGDTLTDFIPFVAWNGLAKLMERYACKGQRLAIAGAMQSRRYINSKQEEVYVIECNANEITLLDKPRSKMEVNDDLQDSQESIRLEDMQVAQETVAEVLNNMTK